MAWHKMAPFSHPFQKGGCTSSQIFFLFCSTFFPDVTWEGVIWLVCSQHGKGIFTNCHLHVVCSTENEFGPRGQEQHGCINGQSPLERYKSEDEERKERRKSSEKVKERESARNCLTLRSSGLVDLQSWRPITACVALCLTAGLTDDRTAEF